MTGGRSKNLLLAPRGQDAVKWINETLLSPGQIVKVSGMTPMSQQSAMDLALAALVWIASDPDRAGAFLAASGAEAGDLRARATDPAFMGFVLDFILQSDDNVLEFSDVNANQPQDVAAARAALPGGDLPHWT